MDKTLNLTYRDKINQLIKEEVIENLMKPIYTWVLENWLGIITENGIFLITKDLKVKKNWRDIMYNKKTKRSFLWKKKELIQDENYISTLLSYTIVNGKTLKNETINKDFKESIEHVFEEYFWLWKEVIDNIICNCDYNKRETYFNEEDNKMKLWDLNTLTLCYFKWTEREKDLDNSYQLVLDSYQKFMEMKKIPFNDKNVNINVWMKEKLNKKWFDTVNFYYLSR